MIKKLTPIKMTEEENQAVQQQLGMQSTSKSAPKSLDPKRFPVFEIPVNGKELVYVPNHVYKDEKGVEHLCMDMPLVHNVLDGRRFLYYRCINGIEMESQGLTGECPLCIGSADAWDYANLRIKAKCKVEGLDPEDKENESVKRIRSSMYDERVVKDANRQFTFPIVVISTQNHDGKTIMKDEEGNYLLVPQWYQISETQYNNTWAKALEVLEDEPTHPGGHFFLLNYTYKPNNGEHNKRDSAKNLSVNYKNLKGSDEIAKKLDELTKDWTPAKARETVVNSVLYSTEQIEYVADSALEHTREMIALMTASGAAGITDKSGEGGEGKGGFNLNKIPDKNDSEGGGTNEGVTAMDDTDMDME